jgi:hypothetical protein
MAFLEETVLTRSIPAMPGRRYRVMLQCSIESTYFDVNEINEYLI